MNPMSLKNLYILVLVVASYSLWKLYLHLQQVSRRRTFRLDQRRKFGIPDHDHRDFQVAKRDAILRRERREANLEEKRIAGQGRSSDDSDPNTQAVRQDGHVYEDLFSHPSRPGMVQVEGRGKGAGLLLESGKEALDTSEMIETRALTTERLGAQARAVLDAKTSGKGRKRFQSELGSEAGGGQRKTRKRELDHDPHVAHPSDTIAWGTSNLRGVKRDPLEAREGYDDSVAGNRSFKRRHKLKPDPAGERLMDEEHGEDFLEEDESMGGYSGDEGLEDDGMDVDVTLSKLVTGERGVKRGFQDHDDEELEVGDGPVRDSSVKGNSKRGKSRHDPLQDTQHDLVLLDEDEAMPTSSDLEDDEDTKVKKLPLEERTTSTSGNKRKADTSDDREPGEEWEDLNGLKWKMGEDGVRRRATIIVEMRPKYNMPKDSQHPDAKQKVQVYVEKYLSELEYEDYKKKKLLGYQEAERMKEAEAKQRAREEAAAKASQGRETATPRKLKSNDLLYSNALGGWSPLLASRLAMDSEKSFAGGSNSLLSDRPLGAKMDESLASSKSPSPMRISTTPLRSGTPDVARANRGGRIALSSSSSLKNLFGKPSPSSGIFPGSPRAVSSPISDEERRKRREESLMRKLKEEKDAKGKKVVGGDSSKPATLPSLPDVVTSSTLCSEAAAGAKGPNFLAGGSPGDKNGCAEDSRVGRLTTDVAEPKALEKASADGGEKKSVSFKFDNTKCATEGKSEGQSGVMTSFSLGQPASTTKTSGIALSSSLSRESTVDQGKPASAPAAPPSAAPSSSIGFTFAAASPKAPDATSKDAKVGGGGGDKASPSKFSFTFGGASASPSSSATNPSASSNDATSAAKPAFTFGGVTTGASASSTDAKPAFTFGGATTGAPTTLKDTTSKPVFTFGSPSNSSASNGTSALKSAPSFTFGSQDKVAAPSSGSKSEEKPKGGGSSTFSFTFGSG